jgi:hypothetical protein
MTDRIRRDEDPEAGARYVATTTDETRVAPEHPERSQPRFARGEEQSPRIAHHDPEAHTGGGVAAGTMRDIRARQRDEFGGINWGASFFGWLSAMGLGAILAALVTAAGATLALTETNEANASNAETIGLVGGILFLVLLGIAYFAGGYVAGRMSRFDGARQGLGVWVIALTVAIVLAVAGALLGGEYNVLNQLNLPNIPIDNGDLATGGLIALALGLIITLLASMAGGKAGERYHRKVDRVAIDR